MISFHNPLFQKAFFLWQVRELLPSKWFWFYIKKASTIGARITSSEFFFGSNFNLFVIQIRDKFSLTSKTFLFIFPLQVHYLRYLNNLYHDDFPGALENLHRYFDYRYAFMRVAFIFIFVYMTIC